MLILLGFLPWFIRGLDWLKHPQTIPAKRLLSFLRCEVDKKALDTNKLRRRADARSASSQSRENPAYRHRHDAEKARALKEET